MKPLQRSAQAGISAQGTAERTVQPIKVGYRLDRAKPGLVNDTPVQRTAGPTLTLDECCYWLRFIHGGNRAWHAVSQRSWGFIRYHAEGHEIAAKKALRRIREIRRSDPGDVDLIEHYQRQLREQLTIAGLCHEALKSFAIETARQVQKQTQRITFIDEADPEVFERLERVILGAERG